MTIWQKISRSNFIIRLTHWEFWPFGIVQFPFFIYWLWLSLRARSLVFFSAANPGILLGGMFGESKYDILTKIPAHLIPKTILVQMPATPQQVLTKIHEAGISFPFICKPDLGERGFMVRRINTTMELEAYLQHINVDFLVQEFVDLPVECGVFYTKLPNQPGRVTSLTLKEMLFVTGDGSSTVEQLILQHSRAKLQWHRLRHLPGMDMTRVPANHEHVVLNAIGNHCLGTMFLNGQKLINEQLHEAFCAISASIDGFFFGRFDLRCQTLNDLYEGRVKIMELNGCGAEPAHIYQPGYSLVRALKELAEHWKNMFIISRYNHRQGVPYPTTAEAWRIYKMFKARVG
jgi:hypothetical protein